MCCALRALRHLEGLERGLGGSVFAPEEKHVRGLARYVFVYGYVPVNNVAVALAHRCEVVDLPRCRKVGGKQLQ